MAQKVVEAFEDLDLTNDQRELLKLLAIANAPFQRYANDCGAREVNTKILEKEARKHPRLKGISEQ